MEFRDAVYGNVFIRSGSFQKYHFRPRMDQGTLFLWGVKMATSCVGYIAPRSAAPKRFRFGEGGAAPAVAGAGWVIFS